MIVAIGQKVRFYPFEKITGFGSDDNRGNYVTGTIVYVNEPHRWFSVEYSFHGVKQRTSFLFCQIGEDVTICG